MFQKRNLIGGGIMMTLFGFLQLDKGMIRSLPLIIVGAVLTVFGLIRKDTGGTGNAR
jgi:hypothetical protein